MEPMDEIDDVLKELENGENPVIKALQEQKTRNLKTAARCRAISKATFALSVAAIAGGVMTIGHPVFPLVGAIAGGALLSIAASAWASSFLYDDHN